MIAPKVAPAEVALPALATVCAVLRVLAALWVFAHAMEITQETPVTCNVLPLA
jgi:hypothetical protein